ncbi:MAG: helix-turn-helix domain-containing protein [Candidatus Micrarchaeota archaeon]
MNLTRREAEILDYLMGKKANFRDAARALGIKKPNFSNYIKKLGRYRMVSVFRKGRLKELSLEYGLRSGFFGAKKKLPHIRLSHLLAGITPFLLSFIKTRRRFRISDLDIPLISAKRQLKQLRNLGIVFMPFRGIYELREEALPAAEFCRNIIMQMHAAEAEQELKTINQAFFSFDSAEELEVVFVTDQDTRPKHYWPTAYSVFHNYGIQLILAGKYYHANIKPKLEDVIIHTLAVSRDARSIMYVAALMLKNKFDYNKLLRKKQRFDLPEEFIKNLIGFVESKGKKTFEGFPSWEEVGDVAYGKTIQRAVHR